MKKKIKKMFTVAVAVAAFAFVFTGCTNDAKSHNNSWTPHGKYCITTVVVIEGHKYIIMDGAYSGGIVHAESCNCKK